MSDEQIVETPEVAPEVEETAVESETSTETEAEAVEEVIAEKVESGEVTEEEAKEMIRTLKFKANGQEMEEELPFDIAPEHLEYLQKKFSQAAGGQEAHRSKAEIEKKYEDGLKKLKENPWASLEELGLDPDQMAEMRIQQRIEEMQKSPEELEQDALRTELAELKREKEENETQRKDAEFARLQKEAEVEMTSQIEEAITAQTNLPNSPYVLKRMADSMVWALDNGYENVKAADIAPLV